MAKAGRIVFLGTGETALPALQALLDAGHDIVKVVVRPPRSDDEEAMPEDRADSPLAALAREKSLAVEEVAQPDSEAFREQLAALETDLGVVVGYGGRFPAGLLTIPRLGWIKIHFSMLPKYRGQHPLRTALAQGEKTLGVSLIELDDGVEDSGPILMQEETETGEHDTFGDVAPKLAELGAKMAAKTATQLVSGKKPKKKKQSEKRAPKAMRLSRRHMRPPWWLGASAVYNRLRSMSPEPGLSCLVHRQWVRVVSGQPLEWVQSPFGEDGSYLGIRAGRLAVLCGESSVFGIERVELEGGEQLSAPDFAQRFELSVGDRFI
ncbi:MAG: methionyl-tRNA formyltransferase [Acidobacteriota bacterium]